MCSAKGEFWGKWCANKETLWSMLQFHWPYVTFYIDCVNSIDDLQYVTQQISTLTLESEMHFANTVGLSPLLPILKYWNYKKSFPGDLSFHICMTVHFWKPSARQFISFDILSSTASEFPKSRKKTYQNVLAEMFLQKKWIYKSICNKIFFRFYRKLKTVFHT